MYDLGAIPHRSPEMKHANSSMVTTEKCMMLVVGLSGLVSKESIVMLGRMQRMSIFRHSTP
jgi:hypothetical protein